MPSRLMTKNVYGYEIEEVEMLENEPTPGRENRSIFWVAFMYVQIFGGLAAIGTLVLEVTKWLQVL